jgi:hypothetical protein
MLRTALAPFLLLALSSAQTVPPAEAPPNEPARIVVAGDRITITYDGGTIFDGRIADPAALRGWTLNTFREGDAVTEVLALTARGREPVEITGTVTAGAQAFPAESDRPLRGLPIVRHTSGPSRSLRNQAVYDRKRDWVLSVDDQPRTRTRVVPLDDRGGHRAFSLDARGTEILLRFRPRFYQRHRGLRFFEPWTYDVWSKPIVGWVSWFAFFDKVTEADI